MHSAKEISSYWLKRVLDIDEAILLEQQINSLINNRKKKKPIQKKGVIFMRDLKIDKMNPLGGIELRFADWLYKKVSFHYPNHLVIKNAKVKTWVKDVDCMIRIDKRDIQEFPRIVNFALGDDFWRLNMRSPSSMRKYYDMINEQSKQANQSKTAPMRSVDPEPYYLSEKDG